MKTKKLIVFVCALCLAVSTCVSAATANPNVNTGNLAQWGNFEPQKRGSGNYSTNYTKAVQRILLHYGGSPGSLMASAGGVDGSFGEGTEKAVKAFQSDQGVTADGSVGPNTWRGLYTVLKQTTTSNGYYFFKVYYGFSSGATQQYYAIRQGANTGNWAVRTSNSGYNDTSDGTYVTFKYY